MREKIVWGLYKDCTPSFPTKHRKVLDATMVPQSYAVGYVPNNGQ